MAGALVCVWIKLAASELFVYKVYKDTVIPTSSRYDCVFIGRETELDGFAGLYVTRIKMLLSFVIEDERGAAENYPFAHCQANPRNPAHHRRIIDRKNMDACSRVYAGPYSHYLRSKQLQSPLPTFLVRKRTEVVR